MLINPVISHMYSHFTMPFDLLSLPVLALDIIFDHLPVWKIRQLACMCHYMNNLKNSSFNRRLHVRLFGGSVYHTYVGLDEGQLYNLNHDYDLNIRFEGEIPAQPDLPYSYVTLSPDWYVRNAEQIDQLSQWFPQIRHLTLVVANRWPQDCLARLFGLWPQIKRLKILNISNLHLDWPQVGPKLSALDHIEHLIFLPCGGEVSTAKYHLTPLLEKGQLKTFISSDFVICDLVTLTIEDNQIIETVDRSRWNRPQMALAVKQLKTLGVSDYFPVMGDDITSWRLFPKIKRLEILDCNDKNLCNCNLNHWMALQFLCIQINDIECSLRTVIAHLSALPNLEQLYLAYNILDQAIIPSKRACKRWPKLPTVCRFQLKANLDPCRFPLLAHSFPNAREMSLRLNSDLNKYNWSGRHFLQLHFNLASLCAACSSTFVRAVDKFAHNIEAFFWVYNRTQTGGLVKLEPKVKLYTVEIEGKTRFSWDYHSIE